MFKKNIVLSSLLSVALFGLAACGGGGSDDSTPTPPGTGGTTNPGTGGGTTNPGTGGGTTPTTPTTPTPVNLEFASGTYILEGASSISEIVVYDNSLYLLARNLGPTLARIDDVNTFVKDKTITNATGVAKIGRNGSLKSETFSITFDDSTNITALSGLKYSAFDQGAAFSGVVNSTDLTALDGMLTSADFSAFSIDAGLNLTATDEYGCTIVGKLTVQSNDIFHAELTYSGASCADAGSYEGTLWAYEHNSVTYLSWLAFNSGDTKLVTGRLDTAPVSIQTGLYVSADQTQFLISKDNRIYYRQPGAIFGFEYTPVAGTTTLTVIGKRSTNKSAELVLPIPGHANLLVGDISSFDATDTPESFSFSVVPWAGTLATSIAGNWNLNGDTWEISGVSVTGTVGSCSISGLATGYKNRIADLTLTLGGGCSGTLTGAATVVVNPDESRLLVINVFGSGTNNISGLFNEVI